MQKINQHFHHSHSLPLPLSSVRPKIVEKIIKILVPAKSFLARRTFGLPLYLAAPIALGCVLMLVNLVGFFMPRSVMFSFGADNCIYNPQLLPKLTDQTANGTYSVMHSSSLNIFGYPIYANNTCVSASNAPASNQTEKIKLSPLGLPGLYKNISITTPPLPTVDDKLIPNIPISLNGNLSFVLDKSDNTFSYHLVVNDLNHKCFNANKNVDCRLPTHQLSPGKTYGYLLQRYFDDELLETIFVGDITTLDPATISRSSVKNDQKVYSKLTSITLTTNKSVANLDELILKHSKSGEIIQANHEIKDKKITISFDELARETEYELSIKQITAIDESQLEKPYKIKFTTSGGPEVKSASVGSYKVDPYSTIIINFDIGLKSGQELSKFASISVNGVAVAASITADGNKMYINPHSPLPRCHDFNIKLNGGLVNQHGIGGGKAWSMNSRTICQQVFSIGSSVQGRGIYAYKFGTGSTEVVFVGGMHGNEYSSVSTLNSWIDYLETRAHEIPAGRSIIVIPKSNPDAVASGGRTNVNGVDLNRNFPADDWQPEVQMPGGITAPKGGGNSPLDQPESAALASYISSINPRLVLTYHAVANIVISNDAGDSVSLGQQYAAKSGMAFSTDSGSDETFEYATTGEFEDWLADKKSVPTLLVELSSMSSNKFNKHRQAMWDISFK